MYRIIEKTPLSFYHLVLQAAAYLQVWHVQTRVFKGRIVIFLNVHEKIKFEMVSKVSQITEDSQFLIQYILVAQ